MSLFFLGVLLHVIESPLPTPTRPSLMIMKQGLINCRQHEAFIKVLMVCVHFTSFLALHEDLFFHLV